MKKAILFALIGLLVGAGLVYLLLPARFPNELRPAQPTSFRAVTARLDAGGDMYVYYSPERMIQGFEGFMAQLIKAMPEGEPENEAATVSEAFRIFSHVGLNEISGLGLSNVSVSPELNRSKIVIYHSPDKNKGLIWQLGGNAPRPLTELDLLPADTAFGAFGELRLENVWSWLKTELSESSIPGAKDFVLQAEPKLAAQGVQLRELLASLTGSVGFFMTLDKERQMTLPGGASSIAIPEPGFALVLGVKSPALYELLKSKLPMAQVSEQPDRKTLKFPTLAAPFPLEPCVTAVKDLVIIATTPKLAESALEARRRGDGLRRSDEFKALAGRIPDQGNGFTFVSPRLWRTYMDILHKAADVEGADKFTAFFLSLFPKEIRVYGVYENRSDGIIWTACHSLSPEAMLLMPAISFIGFGTALALPNMLLSLDKAKQKTTMKHLLSVDLAVEDYLTDMAVSPKVSGYAELKPLLEPFYIKSLPLKDAWGNDFFYKKVGEDSFLIASPGKDGVFKGWDQRGAYPAEQYDQDIIIGEGRFLFGPKIGDSTGTKIDLPNKM